MPDTPDTLAVREKLERLDQVGRVVSLEELGVILGQFDKATGSMTLSDVFAFRSIAARQRGLIELSSSLPEEERQQKSSEWLGLEQVFEQQIAEVLPPDEKKRLDGLLERKANLEQASHVIEAATTLPTHRTPATLWGHWLGWALVLAGLVSLLLGWPWGALVGAILVLAGVTALQNQPPKLTPEPEFRAAAGRFVESFDVDGWVKRYEEAINTDKVLDLSELNSSLRKKFGWPPRGSIIGHVGASEELNGILMTIESQGGRVPIRQAIVMQSFLDAEGPEAFFVRERAKRGYPPL